MDSLSQFRFPTSITFGAGATKKIPELLNQYGVSKPLLVSDQGIATLPLFTEVKDLLQRHKLKVTEYTDAVGNPVLTHVTKGVSTYRQADCDCLVILGGGCALDVGKAIGLMVNHPGRLFDYEDGKADALPVDKVIPPMIAIPTTAGTGSEVGGSSVISDDKTHRKYIIWSPRLIPAEVIADPNLTLGLPAKITAATGVDALTHNIEAYLAKNYHPICDGIAVEGVKLVAANLGTACLEPGDMKARSAMLAASMMGAIAFQKGLGVTHSCAHALSTRFDLHHGLANGIMLAPCLRFNSDTCEDKYTYLAKVIGAGNSAEDFLQWIPMFLQKLGIPASLKELDITPDEELIEIAFLDTCHGNNPKPCRKEDFAMLFSQAAQ